ncbi:MAG: hypothetical protein AB2L14_36190 [Candidatus Xenobiia bacterium LiM19]
MKISYRFLEVSNGDLKRTSAIAFTGYFDESDTVHYVTKKIAKERSLAQKLTDLKPEDAPGFTVKGYVIEWSQVFQIDSPDASDTWDPFEAMEERDKILNLRKTA